MSEANAFRCCDLSPEELELYYLRLFAPGRSVRCRDCICSTTLARRVPVVHTHRARYTATHIVLIAEGRLPTHCFDQASHLCGNRFCINPAHLCWETPTKNIDRELCHKYPFFKTCPHHPPCVHGPTREEKLRFSIEHIKKQCSA